MRPRGLNTTHVNSMCNHTSEQLHIIHYNARSLLPKLDELRAVCEATKPDIICIVETWLDDSISDNDISLTDYQVFRRDRNRHGGGIAVYAHCSMSCKVLLKGGPFSLELISIVFLYQSPFSLCFFYRPPSSPVSFDDLCTTLQIIDPANFSRFLLLGDFNVNFCNTHHFLFSHLQDIMLSFSLTQVVPSHTYISLAGTPSLLDLAMLSNPEQLQQCSTIPPLSTSDHYGISLTLNLETMAAKPCKSRMVWLYRQGDYEKACRMIEETDWSNILTGDDISKAAANWTERFLAIMEECIPRRYLRKRRNLPWLSRDILQLIRKRNTLFKKAKRFMKDSHIQQYKKLRNRVVNL